MINNVKEFSWSHFEKADNAMGPRTGDHRDDTALVYFGGVLQTNTDAAMKSKPRSVNQA